VVYIIKYRKECNGTQEQSQVSGLVFYDLQSAKRTAD